MAQQLPSASDWRRLIARGMQARHESREAEEAALGKLSRFRHLPYEARIFIYPRAVDDDPNMVKNLADFLCSPEDLLLDDGSASEMINILTAILLVEVGRDEPCGFPDDVLEFCVHHLPLKRVLDAVKVCPGEKLGIKSGGEVAAAFTRRAERFFECVSSRDGLSNDDEKDVQAMEGLLRDLGLALATSALTTSGPGHYH